MIILANMEASLKTLDKVLSLAIPFLLITFAMAALIFVLYLPVILNDKYNKRKSDSIVETNKLFAEDAKYIYQHNKYNETIENLTKETKELLKTKNILIAQIEEAEDDIKKGKKSTTTKKGKKAVKKGSTEKDSKDNETP